MELDFDPSFNSPRNELYQYILSVVSSDSMLTLKDDKKKKAKIFKDCHVAYRSEGNANNTFQDWKT